MWQLEIHASKDALVNDEAILKQQFDGLATNEQATSSVVCPRDLAYVHIARGIFTSTQHCVGGIFFVYILYNLSLYCAKIVWN